LYYFSSQQQDFINNLNIHYITFNKHLKNGTYYLGKYLFTREPVLTAKLIDMSVSDLVIVLEKDRVKHNKEKPVNSSSKKILLVDVNNQNNTELFVSLGKPGPTLLRQSWTGHIEYLRNKGLPATQKTLVKYINTGQVIMDISVNSCKHKYFT